MQALALATDPAQSSLQGLPRHALYPDYANPQLLEKIPLNARTILDVAAPRARSAPPISAATRAPGCLASMRTSQLCKPPPSA
jgi:hypothetical protein